MRLNLCKKKKASLFTQLQALFEGLDDNRERSAFSATEWRGELDVWQQVFSETRKDPTYRKQLISSKDKQAVKGGLFWFHRQGLEGTWASPAFSKRCCAPTMKTSFHLHQVLLGWMNSKRQRLNFRRSDPLHRKRTFQTMAAEPAHGWPPSKPKAEPCVTALMGSVFSFLLLGGVLRHNRTRMNDCVYQAIRGEAWWSMAAQTFCNVHVAAGTRKSAGNT